MDFRGLIQREAAVLHKLHRDIHYHFDRAGKTPRGRANVGTPHGRLWREACARFHSHVSPLDHWLRDACGPALEHDAEVRDFALAFLELDPMYLRSGYAKEEMLRHLNRLTLASAESERAQAILIDAVRRRGTREFRRYCRLASTAGSPELREELAVLERTKDGSVASRARMMLGYMDGKDPKQ